MNVIRAAAVQLSPVLYSRESTVDRAQLPTTVDHEEAEHVRV
jgi:hypothetical protein